MEVVFAGSAEFSLPSLTAVAGSLHPVKLVITAPDARGSRGRPAPRPVRDLAQQLGLPTAQPGRLSREWALATPALAGDVLVVCAYGQLIPATVLELFPNGALGVHPSLLPRHRGASPVAAAILAGDGVTGVTIYQMDERLDAGPILAQEEIAISPGATTPELERELADVGARLLIQVLEDAQHGECHPRPQDPGAATYSHKATRLDGELDWALPGLEIERRLRALSPWPGVSVLLGGARVKLLAGTARAWPAGAALATPGTLIGGEGDSALISTGDGAFQISRVQPPGARPMGPQAFLRGRRPISAGRVG
ncbi:MAG TPA: methionyl-tRNA formyltransferase [Candidatus Nanopelagicaceae bacterium]|nr:methionyl-tRNA formyltransferase [Candidatus Nanopelagicaceae bacterium]